MFDSAACIGWSVHVALADSRCWTATELQEVLQTSWYTSGCRGYCGANWLRSRPSRFTIASRPMPSLIAFEKWWSGG
ncbi:hypothetical protein C8F01DRAFT_1139935 [Mycena amicta]|nr:hypothetical protein C8F01DRAFT_1139935 [Mycena amicta]